MTAMSAESCSAYRCDTCGQPATSGTVEFEDRGPFQTIAIRKLACPAGHRWAEQTDGS
ncbi:hypothetical protein [Kitasatospora sp. NBC_01302]|uniref:hypothetical protein n=1 Tax=Kitasatospora sp. NBC_01302 TaxID=2903575 RepID=UPI002E0FD7A7|nr:hypothetical protein OG294_14200 [Kitasatospora sp. NBC_01302]